jgi:hypothetical protein
LVTENEWSIIFNLVPSPFSSSFSLLSCSCHIQQLIVSITLKSSQSMTQRCTKYFDVKTHLSFQKIPSWFNLRCKYTLWFLKRNCYLMMIVKQYMLTLEHQESMVQNHHEISLHA